MRSLEPSRVTARPNGFVLVGVIMFVFVLTILGLSLFTLSSYEAQFMRDTNEKAEAFYAASSGLDRARFLLAATESLGSVAANLGPDIVYAVARQGTDSIGSWLGDATPILVRVIARRDDDGDGIGPTRFLEAQFEPMEVDQYDNLFTLSSTTRGLIVRKFTDNNNLRTLLQGTVRQTWDGPNWWTDIHPLYIEPDANLIETVGPPAVQAPRVADYLTQHLSGHPSPSVSGEVYTLDAENQGDPDRIGFFSTAAAPADTHAYSLWIHTLPSDPDSVIFDVDGVAVWMLNRGLRSDERVVVRGTPDDMLVIVAAQGGFLPGIWLDGGLHSPDVPVILVCDNFLTILNNSGDNVSTTVNWLCGYAPIARIQGPTEASGKLLTYLHPSSSPLAEANLDKLIQRHLLPNVSSHMALQPGSWRDVTESNPN